jgi:hypothetical protein
MRPPTPKWGVSAPALMDRSGRLLQICFTTQAELSGKHGVKQI